MFPFPTSVAFPGAGGNFQNILSPSISLDFAGDPAVEAEVTAEVASYGRQIGWLSDIVLALVAAAGKSTIAGAPDAADSLAKLEAAGKKIAVIKRRKAANALDQARQALARLKEANAPAYWLLLGSLQSDAPAPPPSASSPTT
jgi:hypothetical protein